MRWVTIIWTGVGTASAMLALVHGFSRTRQRDSLGSLLFSPMVAGTSAMAARNNNENLNKPQKGNS